jgi:DNA (cytosine-5)-methyltransferase 1
VTRLISIDLFAGAGGASYGYYLATGKHPDVAVNHNPLAVEVHAFNHPDTEHWTQNIYHISPYAVASGRKIGRMWASPDCTYHSCARGSKPIREVPQRDLPFVISGKWLPALKPLVFHMENVKELLQWGPLDANGRIVPESRGDYWRAFVRQIRRQGYTVDWRILRACDYGVATTRERLYLIARRDGRRIVWPEPTHAAPDSPEVLSGLRLPWRTAAEMIDWSLPCPSIFDSAEEIKAKYGLKVRRPLVEASLRRIARGLKRFVLDNPRPFIVHYFGDRQGSGFRGAGTDEPLSTVTAGGNRHGLVVPWVYNIAHAQSTNRNASADAPLHTVTCKSEHALAVAHLVREFGCSVGSNCAAPASTVMASGQGKTGLVVSWISKVRGSNIGQTPEVPLQTVATHPHFEAVYAFLTKFYGKSTGQEIDAPLHTVCSKEGFGLVLCRVDGETYAVADIGMRMLLPREQAACMSFPRDYVLDRTSAGPIKKEAQQSLIGNSVCPEMARALISVNSIDDESKAYHTPQAWQPTFWPSREAVI